jgi:hypothetical protein
MSGRREAAYALTAYGAYLAVRGVVWNDRGRKRALENAARLLEVERAVHIDVEESVQRAAMRWPRLVDVLNAGYAAGNVSFSVGWLLRLFHRNDADFRLERIAAMAAFVGALPCFALFPTAPPRMLDGYVDTMASRGLNLDHRHLVRFYNPIAAMPSHHVAFAVVTGFGLARRAQTRRGRLAARLYPALVSATVVSTGNHFTGDVMAGAALGAVARATAARAARGRPA